MKPTFQPAIFLLFVSSVYSSTLGKFARIVESAIASNTTYDFIIVGAGIGGLTVADRLTEDLNSKSQSSSTLMNMLAD